MRLSLKSVRLFVVLATLAGSLFAFSPDASAHKNTGTVALVAGQVKWPQELKPFFQLRNRAAQNFGGASSNASSLSLDLRAGNPSSPLNGCRLKGGNSGKGLPVGHTGKVTDSTGAPQGPEVYTNHDLCFTFVELTITSVGLWDGLNHKTSFDCDASGTTGASGNDKGPMGNPSKLQDVSKPTFGAFYGEFTCDGSLLPSGLLGVQLPAVGTADGHFHGLSIGTTTIGFLGEVHCTVANPDNGQVCPKDNPANRTRFANGGRTLPSGLPNGDHNDSRIKHTIACKGEVVPLLPPLAEPIYKWTDFDGDGTDDSGNPVTEAMGDTISAVTVALECLIA